jgi:hypothetical protein
MKADGEKDFVLQLGKVRSALPVYSSRTTYCSKAYVCCANLRFSDHRGLLQYGLPLPALPAAGLRHLHRQVHTLIDACYAWRLIECIAW